MTAANALRRVVAIGPECTGKTSLVARLAGTFGVPWSPEYARTFVDAHARPVDYGDVETIARGQRAAEEEAVRRAIDAGVSLVLHDTDLISTVVYSRHYFGACPTWIPVVAQQRRADLYLLHHVDTPWIEEGFQRAEPGRRAELFAHFRDTLRDVGAVVVAVQGDWDVRYQAAVEALRAQHG